MDLYFVSYVYPFKITLFTTAVFNQCQSKHDVMDNKSHFRSLCIPNIGRVIYASFILNVIRIYYHTCL